MLPLMSHCTSPSKNNASNATISSEYESNYDDGEDETDNENEETDDESADVEGASEFFKLDSFGLPHPRQANAFETNRMVMIATDRPSDEDLGVCAADLGAMGRTSQNGDSLVQSRDLLASAVSKNPKYYHWCFYRYMVSLDQSLEGAMKSIPFEKRYQEFLASMKTMWILARALDKTRSNSMYFSYLRTRYLQLSKYHFARKLEVITGPLGDKRPAYNLSPGKPAAEFAH